ncbi:hypothetical protein WJX77_006536 [Trebouxia sp. C0004]
MVLFVLVECYDSAQYTSCHLAYGQLMTPLCESQGVELYNVCSLHPESPAAFARPVYTDDSLVNGGQALQIDKSGAIRSKLPQAVLTTVQGICPPTKSLFRLELFSIQRPMHICCTALRSTGMTASLIVDATVLTEAWMMLPPHTYISFKTGAYALWAAVVTGIQTGLLHLDSTLHGITRTLIPRIYQYQATSAAQPVLACVQASDKLKRRVQHLLTSREDFRVAAAHRMQASKKKANMLRAVDWQGQEVLREAATLLAHSLAAEKLAAERLGALTDKEQEAAHLQKSLCDATVLAEALEGKKKAKEDAGPSPVSMPGEDPSPPFGASAAPPVFGFAPTDADRHAGPPASDEAPEAKDAGNCGAPQAAPAADPNPSGDVAGSPAAGKFTFASSGNSFGFSPSSGVSSLTPTFGGASGAATAGSASTTAEGTGKGRATAGTRSAAKSKVGKSRVKTKAATAARPTAAVATAGAELDTTPFSFSGGDPFAGPSTSSVGFAAAFDQHLSGLQSLAEGIAGPKFVAPQQHQFQELNSSRVDNTAVAAFVAQHMLQVVDLATAEGKHALAVQLLTQVLSAAYAFGICTYAELAGLHEQRAISLAAAGLPLAAFMDNLTSVKLDMSSPAGACVADQLARWGFTAEMESFASQLKAACWHVTCKFANANFVSCTSAWSLCINQLGQDLHLSLILPLLPAPLLLPPPLVLPLSPPATFPSLSQLMLVPSLTPTGAVQFLQALREVEHLQVGGPGDSDQQTQRALMHLQQIPMAGRLEGSVAYRVTVIDDSLLPKLQALSEAWYKVSTSLVVMDYAGALLQLDALRSRQKEELASVMSPGCCAKQALLSAAVHSGLAGTKSMDEMTQEAFYVKLPLLDLLAAFAAKLDLLNSLLPDTSVSTEERAFMEQLKVSTQQQQEVHGRRLHYQLLFGLSEPLMRNSAGKLALDCEELSKVKKAKLRLAQLHSTDKAWKWFTVDFAVAGLGFKDGIACKLGAQATERRLACREVAQLINCAVDDLTDTRSTGLHPSSDDTISRDPPSGSAEGHNGPGDRDAGPGNSDSTESNSAPSRDHGSGSGDWRGVAGGCDGVSSSPELPKADFCDHQQGSQVHSEASQVPFSGCTDCKSDSEIPPWETDSQSLSDSGPQLSVGEQEWAAELGADAD